jgi:alcohol dehydrogenase YqhD (iron-dependent ADH family)
MILFLLQQGVFKETFVWDGNSIYTLPFFLVHYGVVDQFIHQICFCSEHYFARDAVAQHRQHNFC